MRFLKLGLVFIFISNTLALPAIAEYVPAEGSQSSSLEENVFLTSLLNRLVLFENINIGLLKRRIQCLEIQPTPSECTNEIAVVRSTISVDFPMIRQQLATYNLLQNSPAILDELYNKAMNEKRYGQWDVKIPLSRLHYSIPYSSAFKDDVAQIAPSSKDWAAAAVQGYADIKSVNEETGELKLVGFDNSWSGYMQWECQKVVARSAGHIPQVLCQRFHLEYDPKASAFYFSQFDRNGNKLLPLKGRDYDQFLHLYGQIRNEWPSLAAHSKQELYSVIQVSPYVALVPSEKPTFREISQAFRMVLALAEESLADWEKKRQSDMDRSDYLELMGYAPVVRHLLTYPSDDMRQFMLTDFTAVADNLDADYQRQKLVQGGLQMAGILGAVLMCMPLKPFRVASFALGGRKLLRSYKNFARHVLCISGSQVAINSYFIYESWELYEQVFSDLFIGGSGSPENPLDINGDGRVSEQERVDYEKYGLFNRTFREVESLESAQSSLLWAGLFSPLGTLGTAKYFLNKMTSLSAPARAWLTSRYGSVGRILRESKERASGHPLEPMATGESP